MWTIDGVHGTVSLLVNDEVIMIYTAGHHTVSPDEMFGLATEGQPVELTPDMAMGLATLLITAAGIAQRE